MPMTNITVTPVSNRIINAVEVYYKRDNVKRSRLFSTRTEANKFRNDLRWNHRRFLGMRNVKLAEVA